ncbi:hypothetical protein DSECCO2_527870 [anaerobic digester metagenome]
MLKERGLSGTGRSSGVCPSRNPLVYPGFWTRRRNAWGIPANRSSLPSPLRSFAVRPNRPAAGVSNKRSLVTNLAPVVCWK